MRARPLREQRAGQVSRRHTFPADVGEGVRDRLQVIGRGLHDLDRGSELPVVRSLRVIGPVQLQGHELGKRVAAVGVRLGLLLQGVSVLHYERVRIRGRRPAHELVQGHVDSFVGCCWKSGRSLVLEILRLDRALLGVDVIPHAQVHGLVQTAALCGHVQVPDLDDLTRCRDLMVRRDRDAAH